MFIYNVNLELRYLDMVINNATTQISFFPVVSFEGIANIDVEVWHKNTKTKCTDVSAVTTTGTMITIDLPSLTPINLVAKNLDTCLIRVLDQNIILFEYLSTWSDESTNNYKTFKEFTTTTPPSPNWIAL